jgi:hypothetical protein
LVIGATFVSPALQSRFERLTQLKPPALPGDTYLISDLRPDPAQQLGEWKMRASGNADSGAAVQGNQRRASGNLGSAYPVGQSRRRANGVRESCFNMPGIEPAGEKMREPQ